MKDNKDYNIYKFDIRNKLLADKKLDDKQFYQLQYKRAIEHCLFQQELFKAFSKREFEKVKLKTKDIFDVYDICMKSTSDNTGLEYHLISESYFYRIPKSNKNLSNFFESRKPKWVIKLSKI